MEIELWHVDVGGQRQHRVGRAARHAGRAQAGEAARRQGRSLFNWIAEVRTGADGAPPPERENWNRVAGIEEFAHYFEDFRFDWLDEPALARASGQAFAFPMVDRDPLPRWTHGRVTLLGDAAHPMWPIGSNGASQAVRDERIGQRARRC